MSADPKVKAIEDKIGKPLKRFTYADLMTLERPEPAAKAPEQQSAQPSRKQPERITHADIGRIHADPPEQEDLEQVRKGDAPQPADRDMGTQQGTQRSTLPGTHIADYQSHTDKLSTQSGTYVGTQIRQGVYPTVYPPGVDIAGTQTGTRLPVKPRRKDTRAQLNLKISLEKMFQLRDFCESTGRSQKEAIEEAIGFLCGVGTQPGVDKLGTQHRVHTSGRSQDQIDLSICPSIIDFYKAETGNEWTPADDTALQRLVADVPVEFISAGIIKSLIGCSGPVQTFAYCAKTALQIATSPDIQDPQRFLVDLWRRYDRNKESIRRKQRGA